MTTSSRPPEPAAAPAGETDERISFNVPTLVGEEFDYIRTAIETGHISGNGGFTQRAQRKIEELIGSGRVLLTHSCTAGLEMAAILAGISPGDEVIMPSFTFASTANAIVLRGGVPVFVDIRPDTLNIDERLIESAVTARTKAICAVHYAGVGAEMDAIMSIARERGLVVIEDAAQGLFASYRGRPLGAIGDFGAFSFHETKNIISGEGGALVVQDPETFKRAEIIWEKGTNRAQFARGEVSKYTWVDVGSSYLPSEIVAAFLLCQLEAGRSITDRRVALWDRYHAAFADLEGLGVVRRPVVPSHCAHNGHIFYLLVEDAGRRDDILAAMQDQRICAIMHYVPLHGAPAGRRYGREGTAMTVTDDASSRLIRLPLHPRLTHDAQDRVIDAIRAALRR